MRTITIIAVGLMLTASISCKKIGCVSEWAKENDGPENAAFDTDCLLGVDPFVGTYTMHFVFDDNTWVDNGNGTISWITKHYDYYVHDFEITLDEEKNEYFVRSPGRFGNRSLPANRTDSLLSIYYFSGPSLTTVTYNGEAILQNDTLYLDLSYYFDNWTGGFDESIDYLAKGVRNE